MSFSKSIENVVSSWEGYRRGKTTNKKDPVHSLVVDSIPGVLRDWTPNQSRYKIIGSDGRGNILRTPWFAVLDREITESATRGYYLVYLLSSDLKSLVLEVGFGATQFEDRYGKSKRMYEALDSAVVDMRQRSQHLFERLPNEFRSRVNRVPVVLDKSGDFRLKSYEHCSIYSLVYNCLNLPSDSDLRNDYLSMLRLYGIMCGSLLLAEVDSYVFESVEIDDVRAEVQVKEFEPRNFKKRNPEAGFNASSQSPRHSKSSDKVGRMGEQIVFDWEKRRLSEMGREDLASSVIWHRFEATNRTPGWDVTSFDEYGNEFYIEVKASEGKDIRDVELTSNEWQQAEKHASDDRYFVYAVTDVFATPTIEIISNPAKLVLDGTLSLSIARYSLMLGKYQQID